MTRQHTLLAGFAAIMAMLLGALFIRGELTGLGHDQLDLIPPMTAEPTATNSPTPVMAIRVLPPAAPTASAAVVATPPTTAPVIAPTTTPTPPRYQVLLPIIGNGGFPVASVFDLTPEPARTPGPTFALTPAPLLTPPPLAPTPPPGPPQPTDTPRPTRGPQRATKLGIGLYDSGGAHMAQLEKLRPSVILLMDPTVDFAQSVRKTFPKAFIVGRIYDQQQPLDNPEARGVEFADRVARLAVPLKGSVDAWMSYNEVVGHNDYAKYEKYNRFQVSFAHRLQDNYGISAVASNDASATVEPFDYPKYFRESISASRYFGIHAYSPVTEASLRSTKGRELVLRYRQIHDELTKAGVQHGDFLITEVGLWDGWKGVTTEQSMADDFIWYGEELAKDDYVVGAMIFGLFVGDRWQQFNIASTSMMDRIGDYNTAH